MDEPIFRAQSFSSLKGLSVVIPCYKEDVALVTQTYCELALLGAEVIIVDDGDTMDLPDDLNFYSYQPQMGYGYAIKEGIKRSTQSIVCTMDGDGQHKVQDVLKLYSLYKLDPTLKLIVGQRWNLKETWHRWFGRKVLNFLASCISGHYLSDLNSGMRLFTRSEALGYSPILCDTFSFTTSLTMAMVTDGHKMTYFPIDVQPRAFGKSHVRVVKDGIVTLYYIIWVGLALRTRKMRAWLRRSVGQ